MPSNPPFKIEDGVLALSLVDKAAVGYQESWQTPGGKQIDTVTLADYTTGTDGADLSCATTSAALNASANTADDTTPATLCGPEVTTTTVGVTSWTLDATILQDPNFDAVSAYLIEHDTKEAYFYLALNGDAAPPAAAGRARVVAAAFGGDARVTLTADFSLPVSRKPDFWIGNSTTNRVILGDGSTPVAAAATAPTEPVPEPV